MKKFLLFIVSIVLIGSSAKAWITNYPENIVTTEFSLSNAQSFTVEENGVEKYYKNDNGSWRYAHAVCPQNGQVIYNINSISNYVSYFKISGKPEESGVFVGSIGGLVEVPNDIYLSAVDRTDNMLSCTPAFITSVEVTYLCIDDETDLRLVSPGCETKLISDGDTFIARFTPLFPTSSLFLTLGDNKVGFSNTSVYSKLFMGSQLPLKGVIITKIKVNTVKSNNGETLTHAKDYVEAIKNFSNQNRNTGDLAAKHVEALQSGDVNEDGSLNAADVVTVYNNIINGSSKEHNGHTYINLGLRSQTMWATCNVGATLPEACGNYYAWKEYGREWQQDKIIFTKDNYTWDGKNPEGWDSWTMPTSNDYKELLENTTASYECINNQNVVVLTSKINGNKIVFPCANYAGTKGLANNYNFGFYWTSTTSSSVDDRAGMFAIEHSNKESYITEDSKYIGNSVRMVFKTGSIR